MYESRFYRLARVRHSSITQAMNTDTKRLSKDFRREKRQLDEEHNKLILNLRIVSFLIHSLGNMQNVKQTNNDVLKSVHVMKYIMKSGSRI